MEMISKLRWAIVVLLALLALVFVGWGMSAIARSLFNSTSSDTTTEQVQSIKAVDVDVVRYTVDGPIVASSDHERYTIEVSRNVVIMRLYSDYGQTVKKEQSYRNNSVAYENFVKSLDTAKVTSRISGTDLEDDEADTGRCPDGRRFIVEIGDDIRRWTTSCEKVKGTAGGRMTAIGKLFREQVPDFNDLLKGSKLRY